jgi:hypothetical protein
VEFKLDSWDLVDGGLCLGRLKEKMRNRVS